MAKPGDVIRTTPFVVIKGLTKTNTAISKGDLLAFDTDGWAPALDTHRGPFGVALNDQTAEPGVQKVAHVMLHGQVRIKKVAAGVINQGQAVMPTSAEAGKVKIWEVDSALPAYDATNIDAIALDTAQCIGIAVETAPDGQEYVEVVL